MDHPPSRFRHSLVDAPLLLRSYGFLGLLEAASSMTLFFLVLPRQGHASAMSACLSTIIVMQIANVWLCRSETESVFRIGIKGNLLIWLGVVVEFFALILVNYSATAKRVLSTSAIPPWA
jgi:sodium/potassium-transporting ATPase subunit alpha